MRRLVVLLLLGSVALGGTALPAGAASTSFADIQVTGPFGEKPTVTYTPPFSTKKTVHREIIAGTGDTLKEDTKVTIDLLVVDARTGEELANSYSSGHAVLLLDPKRATSGLVTSLIGTRVGSRVLIGLPPKAGVVGSINRSTVKKNDTLLFVVDVIKTLTPLERAKGTAVAPVEGLPTVKLAKNGTPKVRIPKGAAPTELVVQPLIVGAGPVVAPGQTITTHYVGVKYKNGKPFDSSWSRGAPVDFVVGAGQVIAGWDEGLVGQTVGSQVLLVVPPSKGYGKAGNKNAGISGTDTIVFVVDILDAI